MTTLGIIAVIFRQAGSELWRHKLRSFLTMFGIGWGICALALLMASGEGFREGQLKSMEQLGYRIVLVYGGKTEMQAGGQRAGKYIRLYRDDVQAIREQCPAVSAVSAEIKTWNVSAESNFNSGRFLVLGVDSEYMKIRNLPAALGRDIGRNDVENSRRVCVLGDSVRKQLFEDHHSALGKQIRINGFHYQVVGLMSEKDQNSSYDGWDNDKILIPTSSLRRDCPSDPGIVVENRVNVIVYQPESVEQWEEAQQQVRRTLGRIHGFDPRDEAALPMWDTIETATMYDDVTESINLFLGAVAVITLSLGGLGVMNTMFTSVAERTSEIGLKKALGARQVRILGEFFLEGMILALLSGGIGILLVIGLAGIVNTFPMPDYFSGLLMNAALVFKLALALGSVAVLAALPPAWRAGRMDPVVAMNYEK
jgi:putative ABC transport system permease protein